MGTVALVDCLAVGAIGLSEAKAATTRPAAKTLVKPVYGPGYKPRVLAAHGWVTFVPSVRGCQVVLIGYVGC